MRGEAPAPGHAAGAMGEVRAEQYLASLGMQIIAHNVRIQGAEIDLVALDGRTVVFAEVKLRSGARLAARETVTPAKQRRISRAALWDMQRYGLMDRQARFDVIEIQDGHLTHLPNAFPYQGPVF